MPHRSAHALENYSNLGGIPDNRGLNGQVYAADMDMAYGRSSSNPNLEPWSNFTAENQFSQPMADFQDFGNSTKQCMIPGLTADCWTSPDCPKAEASNGPCEALQTLHSGRNSYSPEQIDRNDCRMTPPANNPTPRGNTAKQGRARARLPHNIIERRYVIEKWKDSHCIKRDK